MPTKNPPRTREGFVDVPPVPSRGWKPITPWRVFLRAGEVTAFRDYATKEKADEAAREALRGPWLVATVSETR